MEVRGYKGGKAGNLDQVSQEMSGIRKLTCLTLICIPLTSLADLWRVQNYPVIIIASSPPPFVIPVITVNATAVRMCC